MIIRHQDFENFPTGTTPHTTAPFDYLILALSILLKPITAHAMDLAGTLISPVLALLGGWFLWVVVEATETPVSMGDADPLRD